MLSLADVNVFVVALVCLLSSHSNAACSKYLHIRFMISNYINIVIICTKMFQHFYEIQLTFEMISTPKWGLIPRIHAMETFHSTCGLKLDNVGVPALYKLRYNELSTRAQCFFGEVWTAWALNLLAHDACLVPVQHSQNNQKTIVVHFMLKKWGRYERHWKHIFQDWLTFVIKLILTARTSTYSCNFLPIFGIRNFSQPYQVSCPNMRLFINWKYTTSILIMERPKLCFFCLSNCTICASQLLFLW